jgi:prepilin-type N-terminal cleavage/methylation domain-containing protein
MGPSRGFTLVEMALVILVLGLIAGIGADMMRGVERRGRVDRTEAALAGLQEAMVVFVMHHKRLPCPADGRLADGHPDAGRENFEDGGAGDCTFQADGVAPTVALGIGTAAGSDGWQRRIAYRVDPVLTRDGAACVDDGCVCPGGGMDLSCIDPRLVGPGNGGIDDKLSSHGGQGLGLAVCAASRCPEGSQLMLPETGSGAAYILISHGRTGLGAFSNGGTRVHTMPDETPVHEAPNLNSQVLGASYVDRQRIDRDLAERESFFDDYVARPSVLHVAREARLEPQAAP